MSQIAPCVNTLCSYSATSVPRRRGVEHLGEDHVGRAIALHHPVRHDVGRRALGADLVGGLAEGQRLGLGEDVRREDVVVVAQRVEGLAEADEVDRDQPRALVDQLVEAVLAVRPRLTPVHRAGVVVDPLALERDVLAVGLHRQLLQVRREPLQVLVVRHHADRLDAEEVDVPDRQQAHQHGQVLARAASCGSARPSRGSRPASPRTAPARWRSSSRARSPNPSSSGRRPSPRSRTCWRCRCRTRRPSRRSWTRRRSAWRRPRRHRARKRPSHAPTWRWSASPGFRTSSRR